MPGSVCFKKFYTRNGLWQFSKSITSESTKKNKNDPRINIEKLRSTGGQQARLYGLAKVHKERVPLRPVPSLPGSWYHYLTGTQSFFSQLQGGQIETTTDKMKTILTVRELRAKKNLFSLDNKRLYTRAPVKKVIGMAVDSVYKSSERPLFDRKTIANLSKLDVEKLDFTCDENLFNRVDDIAMVF